MYSTHEKLHVFESCLVQGPILLFVNTNQEDDVIVSGLLLST